MTRAPHTRTQVGPLIVGVGASAGGLDALQELLASIGDSPNMAIVFVQHRESASDSLLTDLLKKSTSMSIVELAGRKKLKPDTLYLCPPHTQLDLRKGLVSISAKGDGGRTSVIDHFFHALAEDQGERGIGVILSGSGSDGTLGLKAISDSGGMTFAQSEKSAKFDSMPRSAATTGVADHVMAPAEIATELLAYVEHLDRLACETSDSSLQKRIEDSIPLIAKSLMDATSHDFKHYKTNTLVRRIQRRMHVLRISSVAEYVSHLGRTDEECQALFRELLIGVTAFFRDPDAFASLQEQVLPKLFEGHAADETARIWVAGCANGAEAYTMAILCREAMDEFTDPCKVQIFATDIDERALRLARAGTYPSSIEDHIQPERLKRFFVKRGKKYQVAKEIRDLVLFGEHNLISDPPFSRQDLICCRNLLIYLGPHLQNKLIPLFHYALRPSGYLFLGPSENITSHGDLFRSVDARQRISQRRDTAVDTTPTQSTHRSGITARVAGSREPDTVTDLTALRQRILLDEFSPKSCVINESGQVLDAAAHLEKYLSIVDGAFQNNILTMATIGLRIGLRAAIAEAKSTARRVTHENMSMRVGEMIQRVTIIVQPMPPVCEQDPLYMIVFHDVGLPVNRKETESPVQCEGHDADAVITQLELELETTRIDLDQSIQDMDAANEELKSSNEELLSMNEELQSANEELETSKEEIRATSDAVARANSDMENLLRSTQIATVFLDDELRIRSFTPAINDIYELLPTDIGRPLERFVPSVVDMPRLPDPKALKGDDAFEPTVLASSGKAYIRRVLPYRSHTGETDGIVVTFADVTELRESEQQFRDTFDNAAVGIAHVGLSGEWLQVNNRLCEITGHTRDALLSKTFQDITHPDDLQADLHQLQMLIAGKIDTYSMEKRYLRPSGDPVWINLTVSVTRDADGQPDYVIAVIEDIDEKVRQRSVVQESERNWRLVVDVAQMGVLRIDYLKNTIIADARAARLYSVPADTPIPRGEVHARFHPDDRQMIEDLIAASMEPDSDGQFTVEHRVLVPDGTLRWLNVRKQVFYQEIDGRRLPTHGVLAAIDITEKNEAAQQLLKAKERSDLAMATGRLGEWEWDVRGDVVTWGDSLINLLGYSRDNAPRNLQDFVAAIHPDDHATTAEVIQSALHSSHENYWIENRMLRANGEVVWIEGRGKIYRDRDGQPLSIVGMATDITERKIAELKLADREAHLRRVIDGSLGFLVVLGTDGTLLEPNAAALASIDMTRDELVGRKLWDCYWWSFDPGVQAQVRELVARAAQGEAVRQDLKFRVSNDQRKIGDAAFSPVLDEHGIVSHVVGSGVDITDRAAAEAALFEREQRLSFALQAGQMGTFTSHLDSQKLIWSDSTYAILGVENTGKELNDKDLLDIVHPDDREALVANREQSLAGDETDSSFEFRVIRPADGHTAWVSERGTIARDADGQARQIAGVVMDITTRKQAELVIVRRESELRRILDNVVGLVGVLDQQGNLLEANEAALRIGGVARKDVIGKPFWECYWWNFDAAVAKRLRASFKRAVKGDLIRYDAEVRTADEGRATIDFMLAPVKDADGTITHVIPSAVDVTQRRRTELELADSRAQLAATMEAAKMGSFQWEPDTDLADWDDSWTRVMGISADAPKVGQTFFDLVHPDDLAALKAGIPHPAHEPQPYQSEYRIIRPDGEVRWLVGNGILQPARNSQPARLIGLNWDITNKKLDEERIRQGEERLQMAMRAAGLSHWEWDIDNDRIIWANELFQQQVMQPQDSIGGLDGFLAMVHDDDRDSVREHIEAALAHDTPYRAEFRMRRSDGTYRWLLAMGHVTFELGGKPTALVGVEMDVTDRHEYENQLRKARQLAEAANESKSEFVANMSHEIRTPMTAVLGYADLLFAREDDPEKMEHLRTIKRNGNFLLEIINDILDLSMIEAGKMAIERVEFSPSKLVADVHSMMQVRAGDKELQFEVDYDGPVPEKIASDPRRLKQILVNLIGNAIKFTEVGSIRITVRYLGSDCQQLQFEVSDSGIGMTEEQRLRLFQPFAQGDTSISRRFGGAGLGLAISQRLAGILGGDISVVSRSGKGSVFTFTIATGAIDQITLIDPTSNPAIEFAQDTTSQGIQLDGWVLVVDDQSDIRLLVKHFLTGAGASVVEAEDGEAAVMHVSNSLAGKRPVPDLILLDMQMPRLDGYGTVKELRKIGYQSPVIALTANAMQSDMDRCLASGCDAYLSKPIVPSVLLRTVEQLMNREREQDQHSQSILIVDDSVDTVRLLKLLLERDGKVVSSAYTGKEAIESARKLKPQTVIVDLTLPDMTGFEVLASLKAMPHLCGTRFLALTGHTDESDVRRCLEAGFHQHVAKPIDIASLRDLLNTQAANRP